MSHHLDTPLAAQSGQLFIDDLYVFPGAGSTVFVMNVNSTITGPDVKPGFHSEARYEFKLHVNGSPLEDQTYRIAFGEPDAQGRQSLELQVLTGNDACRDNAEGQRCLLGRTGETISAGAFRVWAGRIADPFYIDLSLLSKVNAAVKEGSAPDLSGWRPERATNSFIDTTVESIVLEVSHNRADLRPDTRIGVWCATKLATDAGGWRQINRAGHPMMWPIFWPDDTEFKNPADTRHPSEDWDAVGKNIGEQIAAVVGSGAVEDAEGYGQTVSHELFPDVLPYVVGTPATYGFAGFNGRSLADNAPEAMLSLVAGTAVPSGLKPSVARHLRDDQFPYVVPA